MIPIPTGVRGKAAARYEFDAKASIASPTAAGAPGGLVTPCGTSSTEPRPSRLSGPAGRSTKDTAVSTRKIPVPPSFRARTVASSVSSRTNCGAPPPSNPCRGPGGRGPLGRCRCDLKRSRFFDFVTGNIGYKNSFVGQNLQEIQAARAERRRRPEPSGGEASLHFLTCLRAALADPKLFDFLTRLHGGSEPSRNLATTRPSLRCLRITIFRQHARIFATRLQIWRFSGIVNFTLAWSAAAQHGQSFLEFTFLCFDPGRQDIAELFMKRPEIVKRHGPKLDCFYRHS